MKLIKKIIRKIYHFIAFLSLFFLFSNNVYAVDGEIPSGIRTSDISLAGQAQFYDTSHNSVTTSFASNVGYMPYYHTTAVRSGFLSFQLHSALVTDVLYQLVVYYGKNGNIQDSRTPVAGGTWLGGANNNNRDGVNRADVWNYLDTYNIATQMDVSLDSSVQPRQANLSMAYYTFSVSADGLNYINVPFSFSDYGQVVFYGYSLTIIKSINGLSASSVQSIINNSGLATANSVSQVQSSVAQVQQELSNLEQTEIQNTQDIINNQTDNTDRINEKLQTEFNNCSIQTITNTVSSNIVIGALQSDGTITASGSATVSPFYKITPNKTYNITLAQTANMVSSAFCTYDINKVLIGCETYNNRKTVTFTSASNAYYFRTTNTNYSSPISISGEFCENRLDSINSSLTDETPPNIDLNIGTASDTPISDLLTMPLTILNSLIQNLGGTCSPYTIPFFYNTTVTFPCIVLEDYLGTNIVNYIDLFICLYMCYNIGMLAITIFDDITSLNDIFNSLYEPRHAYTGYKPRHAKGGD